MNQDTVVQYIPRDPVLMARKGALFIIADGIRGCPHGEVASRLAARIVLRAYYADPSPDPAQSLRAAVEMADGWLRYWAAVRPDLQGMGTTLTAVAVRGDELIVAHVGDSRAYLVRGGHAWLLTRDHTWVADAVAKGLLTPQEAAAHPWRHFLTRSLGGRSATVDVQRVVYAPGDQLVLCSDGVSDVLAPQEIGWLAARSPRQAAQALVQIARWRSGWDDASAIVVALGWPTWQPWLVVQGFPAAPRLCYEAIGEAATPRTSVEQMLLLALGLSAAWVVMLGIMALVGG